MRGLISAALYHQGKLTNIQTVKLGYNIIAPPEPPKKVEIDPMAYIKKMQKKKEKANALITDAA